MRYPDILERLDAQGALCRILYQTQHFFLFLCSMCATSFANDAPPAQYGSIEAAVLTHMLRAPVALHSSSCATHPHCPSATKTEAHS